MKNVNLFNSAWCYSIYGDDTSKYYEPMKQNIKKAKDESVALVLHTNGENELNVRNYFGDFLEDMFLIVHYNDHAVMFPKILRFLSTNHIASKFYFFKDSDSVVTSKEIDIMNKWMKSSNQIALIIRDHPLHIAPILAGMFGVNHHFSLDVANSAQEYFFNSPPSRYNQYSYDQDWLQKKIYPVVADKATVKTSFFYYSSENITRIKRELDDYQYIGAQVHNQQLNKSENLKGYLQLYGDDLLSIPYYPKLNFLYGKVRPTLLTAYILAKLIIIYSYLK